MSAIFIKFLFFTKWQPFKNYEKCSFRSRDIQIFVFLSFPFFLSVGHFFRRSWKINPKVHDAINCLNKNSIKHFVWYLGKEKSYDIETLPIDGLSIKNIFIEKSCRKCAAKASPRPRYNFGKNPKTAIACKKLFLK